MLAFTLGVHESEVTVMPRLAQIKTELKIDTWREFAKLLGISESYLSEIRWGKKVGKRKAVDFALRLGISVEELIGTEVTIPMLSLVSAADTFDLDGEPVEMVNVSHLVGLDRREANKYYALRVKDDSFIPYWRAGDILIVKRGTWDQIESGNKVIYRPEGCRKCSIKYVEMVSGNIILHTFPTGPSEIISKAKRKCLEKIMYTTYFRL